MSPCLSKNLKSGTDFASKLAPFMLPYSAILWRNICTNNTSQRRKSGTLRNPAHREISTSYPRPLSRPHSLRDDELMPSPTLPRASSSESTTTSSQRRRQLAHTPTIALTLTLDDTTGSHSRPSLNPPSPPVRLRTLTMCLRSCLYASTLRVTLTCSCSLSAFALAPSCLSVQRRLGRHNCAHRATSSSLSPLLSVQRRRRALCRHTSRPYLTPSLYPMPLFTPLLGLMLLDSQFNHSIYDYENK